MNIIVTDPYEHFYDPQTINYRKYPRLVVEGIDQLVKLSRNRTDVVTASDWMVVGKIVEYWCRVFPNEWIEFQQSMEMIKGTRARADGYSKEKGRQGVRYLAAVPGRLMRLIKICFPQQQWDREFTDKFIRNFQVVRVGEKVDTWFSIPEAPMKRKTLDEQVKEITKPKKKK